MCPQKRDRHVFARTSLRLRQSLLCSVSWLTLHARPLVPYPNFPHSGFELAMIKWGLVFFFVLLRLGIGSAGGELKTQLFRNLSRLV